MPVFNFLIGDEIVSIESATEEQAQDTALGILNSDNNDDANALPIKIGSDNDAQNIFKTEDFTAGSRLHGSPNSSTREDDLEVDEVRNNASSNGEDNEGVMDDDDGDEDYDESIKSKKKSKSLIKIDSNFLALLQGGEPKRRGRKPGRKPGKIAALHKAEDSRTSLTTGALEEVFQSKQYITEVVQCPSHGDVFLYKFEKHHAKDYKFDGYRWIFTNKHPMPVCKPRDKSYIKAKFWCEKYICVGPDGQSTSAFHKKVYFRANPPATDKYVIVMVAYFGDSGLAKISNSSEARRNATLNTCAMNAERRAAAEQSIGEFIADERGMPTFTAANLDQAFEEHADNVLTEIVQYPNDGDIFLYRLDDLHRYDYKVDGYRWVYIKKFGMPNSGPSMFSHANAKFFCEKYNIVDQNGVTTNKFVKRVYFRAHVPHNVDEHLVLVVYSGDPTVAGFTPHRNSKSGKTYLRTKPSILRMLKEKYRQFPKKIFMESISDGLEIRNLQQIHNAVYFERRRHRFTRADLHSLYALNEDTNCIHDMRIIPRFEITVVRDDLMACLNKYLCLEEVILFYYMVPNLCSGANLAVLSMTLPVFLGSPTFVVAIFVYEVNCAKSHEFFLHTIKGLLPGLAFRNSKCLFVCDRDEEIMSAFCGTLDDVCFLAYDWKYFQQDLKRVVAAQQKSGHVCGSKGLLDADFYTGTLHSILSCKSAEKFNAVVSRALDDWSQDVATYFNDKMKDDIKNHSAMYNARMHGYTFLEIISIPPAELLEDLLQRLEKDVDLNLQSLVLALNFLLAYTYAQIGKSLCNDGGMYQLAPECQQMFAEQEFDPPDDALSPENIVSLCADFQMANKQENHYSTSAGNSAHVLGEHGLEQQPSAATSSSSARSLAVLCVEQGRCKLVDKGVFLVKSLQGKYYTVTLEPPKCSCSNSSAGNCYHIQAAQELTGLSSGGAAGMNLGASGFKGRGVSAGRRSGISSSFGRKSMNMSPRVPTLMNSVSVGPAHLALANNSNTLQMIRESDNLLLLPSSNKRLKSGVNNNLGSGGMLTNFLQPQDSPGQHQLVNIGNNNQWLNEVKRTNPPVVSVFGFYLPQCQEFGMLSERIKGHAAKVWYDLSQLSAVNACLVILVLSGVDKDMRAFSQLLTHSSHAKLRSMQHCVELLSNNQPPNFDQNGSTVIEVLIEFMKLGGFPAAFKVSHESQVDDNTDLEPVIIMKKEANCQINVDLLLEKVFHVFHYVVIDTKCSSYSCPQAVMESKLTKISLSCHNVNFLQTALDEWIANGVIEDDQICRNRIHDNFEACADVEVDEVDNEFVYQCAGRRKVICRRFSQLEVPILPIIFQDVCPVNSVQQMASTLQFNGHCYSLRGLIFVRSNYLLTVLKYNGKWWLYDDVKATQEPIRDVLPSSLMSYKLTAAVYMY